MNQTINCDVAILGGGLGGLFAAIGAAERGAGRICVFEAGKVLGGNGRMANTFVSSDFCDYGNYETDDNLRGLYRRAMDQLHNTGNPELIWRYLDHARDIAKWFEARGVEWVTVDPNAGPFASDCSRNVTSVYEHGKGPTLGAVLCDQLIEACRSYPNIEFFMEARARHLLTDGGRVTGALVQMPDGAAAVNAPVTILATGGVGGSFASLYRFLPKFMEPGDDLELGGVRTCVGDGIDMAAEIGAQTGQHMNIHLLGPNYAGGRFSPLLPVLPDPRTVLVSRAGERVLDEAYLRDGQEVANRTKGKVYYGLYALDTLREIWDDIHNGEPPYPVEKIPEQLERECSRGFIVLADGIEEAAAAIGAAPETLAGTVARYDASCAAGCDEQLHKDPRFLRPLGPGPYVLLYARRKMDSTQGGITTDAQLRPLRPDGTAIDGIYVIGDHVTGFVSEFYGPGGAGMTFAMVSGYLAGQQAAERKG